ncbi:putative bifunctional diguanylate cyclase/phosphodiesterase [Sphingomonas mucosissima]|uniref:Phytochrome-like protein cph2 n=1 Tax=Sphingomonas mucosissima TaxID=370959 RepID=A0A245ZJL9_9SPHN|nr:bifunctional diguanylate cyclase/phosphodiesterase [Sphingomonas mucosissima]OWK29926.1 phytochrome-like protein cph2 [Sphingomonas mucosissima]
MRLTISTRVSIACAAVIVLALVLLAIGLTVSDKIHDADASIASMSEALRIEDQHDQAQRRLRLDVGDATREAERGIAISVARWEQLSKQADAFERLASRPLKLMRTDRSFRWDQIKEARRASIDFARISKALIRVARQEPGLIKRTMPRFVLSLKHLEASRSEARETLVLGIWRAAEKNRLESRRSIVEVLIGGLITVAIIFGMAIWLRRNLLLPITGLAARLGEFRMGLGDGQIDGLDRKDELGDLARGLFEYRGAVESRRTAERRVEFLAHHDMLTGLANRLLFESRLAHELSRSERTGDVVAVLAIDLDDFKAINDRHGHAGGDQALKRAAHLLSSCVRQDDLVARIGGDEFAIIQVAHAQPNAAEMLISRIFKEVRELASEDIPIRMSIGAALSEPGQAGESLHELADLALYRAKADGRNTARFFNKHLKEEESLRLMLARDLEQAISGDQLRLVFQPIADAGSLRIVGYEALLRWKHPTLGDIAPDLFIPVAESTGIITSVGSWVISRALAAASSWPPHMVVAINLSPLQFRSGDLADEIIEAARRWNVAPCRLELEVTESATLLGFQRDNVLVALESLKNHGAKAVMDDFGTGHSSLSNLKDFAFDKIKIDRSFVASMLTHAPSVSIVKAIIGLGKSLGLTILAEGVETEEQLADLRAWGCNQVQGYLIGKPAETIIGSSLAMPVSSNINSFTDTL